MTKKFETLGDIVRAIEQGNSNPTAFNLWKKGHWYSTSSHEFLYDLKRLVHGLIGLGMERGDKVGILSSPSAHWLVADLAIIIAGGVSVPLFEKISDDNFVYEVAQANLRHIFVQGVEQWKRYERHRHLFDLSIGLEQEPEPDGARSFHEVLKEGEVHWEKHPDLFDQLLDRLKPDDLATIVYTSGSMGVPKGAELTNRALVHLVNQDVFKWEPNEKYLSILPLAHIFARQIIYIMLGWNISIYFLNDLSEFTKVCREQKPHLMIVVPRLLEKVYDGMLAQVEKQTGWKKRLGEWAFELACKDKLNLFQRYLVFPVLDLLVYQYLRAALGGNWRVILCGGAKLDPKLYRFFLRIGVPVYEGWGLTEASTVCVNQPGKIKVGTVGLPLPGARVELGEGNEILVHAPTVMRGYYRHPRASKLAIDPNGWLHTGDRGEIDSEGYVKILGRIKEEFKLSTGEFVVPVRIEQALAHHSLLVDMALVFGERKSFAACFLFPDFHELQKLKEKHGMEKISDEEFVQTDIVKSEIDNLMRTVNSLHNKFERVVDYRFILEPLSLEKGEITPTLKIKRKLVLNKYQHLVDDIYQEG